MADTAQCFLVEWYQRMPTDSDACDIWRILSAAAPRLAVEVVLIVSVPADEVVFGVVRADTADAVTAMCRAVGWPADRITSDVSAHVGQRPTIP